MMQVSFETALKKGYLGEEIIKRYLENKGWVIYQPTTKGAHAFDMLSIKDKRTAIAIDVKAKSKLTFIDATGIDQRHFETYLKFSLKHNMPFWIIFVDEFLMEIYGNCLSELEKPYVKDGKKYPNHISNGKIRIWHLDTMKRISTITKDEAKQLKNYNQRNEKYNL
jgi:hypothetical protein